MVTDRIETTEDWICNCGDRPKSSEKAEEKPKGIKTKGEATADIEVQRRNWANETKAKIKKEDDTPDGKPEFKHLKDSFWYKSKKKKNLEIPCRILSILRVKK